MGIPFQSNLGGWGTAIVIFYGCIRLISALGVPNFGDSYRQVLAGKEVL